MLSVCALHAQTTKPDPQIQKIVGEISADRIQDILNHLTSFETRGNFTNPNQKNRGIGAARRCQPDSKPGRSSGWTAVCHP